MILYYITDRQQLGADEPTRRSQLLETIAAAAAAGVDYVQLRERDLSTRELEMLARTAVERVVAAKTSTRLLINSRSDIAIAVGAAGVHLRSDDVSAGDARALFMSAGIARPIIGISCHSEADVLSAESHGADFAVLGSVFGKGNDLSRALGLESFRRLTVRKGKSMPVLALGGVTEHNASDCLRAGADGIAGIRLFQAGDVAQVVARLRKLAKAH